MSSSPEQAPAPSPPSKSEFDTEAVHNWFGLTYASYLTLPRSLMDAMPGDWQRRMVDCLEEMQDHYDSRRPEVNLRYTVHARDERGRFVKDPLASYRRPDKALIESLKVNR